MLKSKKNKGILLFFVKLALFACVAYFFYLQLSRINWSELSDVRINSYALLGLAFILSAFNLFMEWLKWKNTLSTLSIRVKFQVELRSFFAGILSGFLTPNLIGNFIGKDLLLRTARTDRHYLSHLAFKCCAICGEHFFRVAVHFFYRFNQEILEENGLWLKALVVICILLQFVVYFFLFRISALVFRSKSWMKRILQTVKGKELLFSKTKSC